MNLYAYVNNDPVNCFDPRGTNVIAGAIGGAEIGALLGPAGALAGAVLGAAVGAAILVWTWDYFNRPPDNAYDPTGPKAPGKPGADDGFADPKGGDNWVDNPNGRGKGWEADDDKVWVPTGPGSGAHGGPHWDVQDPYTGDHVNVYPGGKCR